MEHFMKYFKILLSFLILLPLSFILSACNSDTESKFVSFSVELVSDEYVMTDYSITIPAGQKINLTPSDFVVSGKLDNGETSPIPQKTENSDGYIFTSTVPSDDSTPAGSYEITFSHDDIDAKITININVIKNKIDMSSVAWDYSAPFTYDGLEKEVKLKNIPDEVQVTYTNNKGKYVGKYTATAKFNLNTDIYEPIEDMTFTWEITPATLTVTVNNHSILFNDEPANSGYEISGFVNGETSEVIKGKASYSYSNYLKGSNIGDYDIQLTGLSADNYSIHVNKGTLTVEKAKIDLTGYNWITQEKYNYSDNMVYPKLPQKDNVVVTYKYFKDGIETIITGAGKYTVRATIQPISDNYEIINNSVADYTFDVTMELSEDIEISATISDVTLTEEDFEYDGKTQTLIGRYLSVYASELEADGFVELEFNMTGLLELEAINADDDLASTPYILTIQTTHYGIGITFKVKTNTATYTIYLLFCEDE